MWKKMMSPKPDDFVMRSVVNKSGDKVFIIQQVDKKVSLDVIAKNRDMKMEQLLEAMETIVASGTKLNLNYAIRSNGGRRPPGRNH